MYGVQTVFMQTESHCSTLIGSDDVYRPDKCNPTTYLQTALNLITHKFYFLQIQRAQKNLLSLVELRIRMGYYFWEVLIGIKLILKIQKYLV